MDPLRASVQKLYDEFFHARKPDEEWRIWHERTQEAMSDTQAGELPKEISDPSYVKYYDWISAEILELIQPHRKKIHNIIEIGAGTGALSYLLAQELDSSVTLADNHALALEYAARVASHFNQKPTFIQSPAGCIPISTETFDFAHSVGLIEHFEKEDVIEIIMEIRRILKKGGLFYVGVPNFLSPEMIKIWRNRGKGSERWMRPRDLHSFLETAGFHVKEVGYSRYTFDSPLDRWIPPQIEKQLGKSGFGFLAYGLAQK